MIGYHPDPEETEIRIQPAPGVTFLQVWVNEMICPRCHAHDLEPDEDICLDCYISEARAEPDY